MVDAIANAMFCSAGVELGGTLFLANNPQKFGFGLDGMPLLWDQRYLSTKKFGFKQLDLGKKTECN
jgi:hypothetical protein